MGNTCGCSEESLAIERLNELDCTNIFGYAHPRSGSYIEPTKEKTAKEYNVDHFTLQSTVAEDEQSFDRWSHFRSGRSLEATGSRCVVANETSASLFATHSPLQENQGHSRRTQ